MMSAVKNMADMEAEEDAQLESCREERYKLLMGLKFTVERLLAVQASNVWSAYGGFKRISADLEAILCHRIKVTQMLSSVDGVFWPFICGLKWLRPGVTSTMEQVSRPSHAAGQGGKGQMWLRQSLQDHTLRSQLEILVSDPEHLHYHYQEGAFLQSVEYVEAMLLCLQAVESNKVAILADINPKLLQPHKREQQWSVGGEQASSDQGSLTSSMERDSLSVHCSSPLSASDGSVNGRTHPPHSPGMEIQRPLNAVTPTTPVPVSFSTSPLSGQHDSPPYHDQSDLSLSWSQSLDLSDPSQSYPRPAAALPFAPPSTSQSWDSFTQRERGPSDPLSTVQYGVSPPITVSSPDLSADGGEAETSLRPRGGDAGRAGGQGGQKQRLKKCMSETFAPADVVRVESDLLRSLQTAGITANQKKIHIPVKDGQRNSMATWHPGMDQRRASSETKTTVSSVVKGHKRSQSDMGLTSHGSGSAFLNHDRDGDGSIRSDLLTVPSAGGGRSSTPHPASMGTGGQDGTVLRAYRNQASLHRGESVLQPPAKGQTLMSYLSEQDFNCCALLEKENAHFGISDVLISVFEQMKWEKLLRKQSLGDNASDEDESDDEINELKQRIRIRRRERLVEKARKFPANSDGMNDTNTTSSVFSASSPLSSHGFSSLSDCSENSDDAEDQIELTFSGTDTSNLAKLKSTGLSLSMASLYSDAELRKTSQAVENRGIERQSNEKSNFSAEAIALSLLSQFSEKRLPKASELEWLVSEVDAPQALLPLPDSFPISPDDGEHADLIHSSNQTKLRGNLEWAPPRAQIIFTVHPPEKRSVVLSKQKMRCAGCGTKTEPGFVKRLRYCEYMGKYFCQCCHSNETAVIPGRVIMRWDFTQYYVSNFARDLLHNIHSQPLFHVDAINPALYRKVRTLDTLRDLRRQLGHLTTLLRICQRHIKWLTEVDQIPKHWIEDDNLYSMEDFSSVRSGRMLTVLKTLVTEAVNHVDTCPLCQGLGFICEVCQGTEVIFPFQLNDVAVCPVCQACYHKSCFIPGKCPKCSRLEIRRRRLAQMSPTESPASSIESHVSLTQAEVSLTQSQASTWEGGGGGSTDNRVVTSPVS